MLSMLADLADDSIRFIRVCDTERLPLEESRVCTCGPGPDGQHARSTVSDIEKYSHVGGE